jgi:D-glycerate 3-kinase
MHPLARHGPAYARLDALGLTDDAGWDRWATWFDAHLSPGPPVGPHLDPPSFRDERVHWLCVPVARWLEHRLAAAHHRPLIVGFNAPQGAGKSTLAASLVAAFREVTGAQAVALSIDDFYLTRAEQVRLAAAHPGHPFLEQRGYPGTHDVPLGARVLAALRAGQAVEVPRYDKSAHGGLGDRSPPPHSIAGAVDLVLLEGWLLGFAPLEHVGDPHLVEPNEALRAYDAWHQHLDALLVLEMADDRQVISWRVEAEQAMRASGRPGLSDEAITDYVSRFLPAYRAFGPTLRTGRWQGDDRFSLTLDARRVPVAAPRW